MLSWLYTEESGYPQVKDSQFTDSISYRASNLTGQGCRSSVQGPENPLCTICTGYILVWEAKKNMVIIVQEEEYR